MWGWREEWKETQGAQIVCVSVRERERERERGWTEREECQTPTTFHCLSLHCLQHFYIVFSPFVQLLCSQVTYSPWQNLWKKSRAPCINSELKRQEKTCEIKSISLHGHPHEKGPTDYRQEDMSYFSAQQTNIAGKKALGGNCVLCWET